MQYILRYLFKIPVSNNRAWFMQC